MSSYTFKNGFWIDQSRNAIVGATISIPSGWGALLIALLSLLVTLAFSAIWTIVSFAKHRHRSVHENRDASFYQEQVILRNPPSSFSAAWELFKVRRNWTKKTNAATFCKRLLFLMPLAIVCASLPASIFVGKVASQNYHANNVLLVPGNCGFVNVGAGDVGARQALTLKIANDSRIASAYVDECYHRSNSLNCATLPVTRLKYNINPAANCPFYNTSRCLLGARGGFMLETEFQDSNNHFGINAPPKDRVQFRRRTTCAPVRAKDRVQILPDLSSTNNTFQRINFNFGPIVDVTGQVTPYTNAYLTRSANASIGYTLISVFKGAGRIDPAWLPISDFNLSDADVSLHFFASNSVRYLTPVLDPFFSADGNNTESDVVNSIYYLPDQYMNVMGCVDQVQFCKDEKSCTLYLGINQVLTAFESLGPSPAQMATVARLSLNAANTFTYSTVQGQNGNAIQATKKLVQFLSPGLPDNQWQLEVTHWFETGLANLQQRVVEWVDNSWSKDSSIALTIRHPLSFVNNTQEVRTALNAQCNQQRLQSFGSHQSFSFLGFIIVVVICPILIVLSWTIDVCVNHSDKKLDSKDHHKYVAYLANNKQQLLRMALESGGYIGWSGCADDIPYCDGPIAPPHEAIEGTKSVRVAYSADQELQRIIHDESDSI